MSAMRFAVRFAALTAAALLAAGCDSDGNPAGATGNSITVAAGSGTNPTYTWTGGPVFEVRVSRTSDPVTPVWGVVTPGTDGIASPLAHGTVPSGAVATAMTEVALTPGTGYRVSVQRLNGTDYGEIDFTP